MRKIHLLGLAMFAVFAFSAFSAVSAFAVEHEWLDNNNPIPLGTTIAVDSEGTLLLEDTDTGTAVQCEGTNTGDVGSDGTDLVATITVLEPTCDFDPGKLGECLPLTEGELVVVPENLPWLTELVLELYLNVSTLSDMVTADGNGNPAWLVECTVLVLGNPTKADDLCEAALGNTLVTNEVVGGVGVIDVEFMEDFEPFANCDVTVGGVLVLSATASGLVNGLVTILAVDNTLNLSAN
jgi:hypothetical protein